jgi:hypothetical protein
VGWPSTEVSGVEGELAAQAAFAVVVGFLQGFLAGFLIAG